MMEQQSRQPLTRRKTPRRALSALCVLAALGFGAVGCSSSGEVEFTAILPLTGEAETYGQSLERGIEIGMELLASDSPAGYPVTMKVIDSGSDPAKAADLLRQAFTTSIAVIGGVTSDEALAMVDVAEDQERILLSPTASSPTLSGKSRYFFRIFPDSGAESAPLAAFVADRLAAKEVVVVAADDAFGEGATQTFVDSYKAKGEVLGTVRFATDDFDFSSTVTEAMKVLPPVVNDDDVRAIYVAATGNALANALKALREGGFDRGKDYLITSSALANPAVLAAAGAGAERSYFTQTPYDTSSENEPMKSFVEAYKAKYGGESPDIYAAHGYDAVSVLIRALEEGGAVLPSDFIKGMRAVQNHPGVTGTIQFRETGDVQKFMRVYFVSEGVPRDFEEFVKEWQEEMADKMKKIQEQKRQLMRNSG